MIKRKDVDENLIIAKKRLVKNLTYVRKLLRLTLEEFGALIGYTKQTMSNIERGTHPLTTPVYTMLRMVIMSVVGNVEYDKILVYILLDLDLHSEVNGSHYDTAQTVSVLLANNESLPETYLYWLSNVAGIDFPRRVTSSAWLESVKDEMMYRYACLKK